MRQPARSAEQWKAICNEYRRSHQSAENFCARKGLNRKSLNKWLREFTTTSLACAAPASGFIGLHLPEQKQLEIISQPDVTVSEYTSDCPSCEPDLVVELPYGIVLKFRGLKV